MADKTCPKCPNSPIMDATPVLGVIPSSLGESFSDAKVINEKCGLVVRAYECPHCHLVELYHER
jgi:hypothetical protein